MCSMAKLDQSMALSDRTVARIHQDACVGEVLHSDLSSERVACV